MPSAYTVMGYRSYTCRAGESFDLLAGQAYGHEEMSTAIIRANPDYCDVVSFDGGEVLSIPLIDLAQMPATLPPWRLSS